MSKQLSRELAVIVHADVAGSTRLVQRDETLAHQRMQDTFHRFAVDIERYGGVAHEIRGDALVARFHRASDALGAALTFQAENAALNKSRGDEICPAVRVGVSMGEVIIADDTITGAGVVLAQRLEQLAQPGGVVIQGSVLETLPPWFPIESHALGEQKLKGFEQTVRAFSVELNEGERAPQPEAHAAASDYWSQPGPDAANLQLPDNPSIAVLPFTNMSGDPDQEYFADGITEDIITALSKFRWFFVIARNSSFVYKGTAVDLRKVGSELGVRYVLEGSVRKAGARIRITAQLIDAASGNHVWAERYDRNLQDIFELQDEITSTIAAAIEPEMAGSERQRALRKPTQNLGAWDLLQRGAAFMWRHDRASLDQGIESVREAIARDTEFGEAYGYLGFGAFLLLIYEWTEEPIAVHREGMASASRAIAIEQRDYFAHHALGRLHTLGGDHESALRSLQTCLELNPNFALAYVGLAEAHVYAGSPHIAIEHADKATRLSPRDPMLWDMLHYKASAYLRLDDIEAATGLFEKVCEFPAAQYVSSATLAALYAIQGRTAEARKALERARELEPGLSVARMKKVYGMAEERPGSRTQRLLDALRSVGLEEAIDA